MALTLFCLAAAATSGTAQTLIPSLRSSLKEKTLISSNHQKLAHHCRRKGNAAHVVDTLQLPASHLSRSVATLVRRYTPFALSLTYSSTTMPCGSKAAALCTATCPSARDAIVVCNGYSRALKGVKASLKTPMRPELLFSASHQDYCLTAAGKVTGLPCLRGATLTWHSVKGQGS